jgi:outer membrane receptor protein involved in Fe transport
VTDAELDGPVPRALVRVVELNRTAETGEDGFFILQGIPAGTYTLMFSKDGYERYIQSGVVVVPGGMADLGVFLRGQFADMDEFVVRELDLFDTSSSAGLDQVRSGSLSVQDAVGKDFISQVGAGDAASVLKNVVGASIVDGKYATVRGLSDRYVGAVMNGMRIPSADPQKRAVQLDLIPANAIENLAVTKTFSPELPGDFTGGGINIQTLRIPAKSFVDLSFSRKHIQGQTGKENYVTYDGGGVGVWGRHGTERALPAETSAIQVGGVNSADASNYFVLESGANPHDPKYRESDAATRALSPAMGTRITKTPENSGVKFSAGHRRDYENGNAWGMMGALNYSREFKSRLSVEQSGIINDEFAPIPRGPFATLRGNEELSWSSLFLMGAEFGEHHKVSLLALRSRVAEDEAKLSIERPGFTPFQLPVGGPSYKVGQAIRYTERSLNTLQVFGDHEWPEFPDEKRGMKLNWHFARSGTEQEEPDVRFFDYFSGRTAPDTFSYDQLPAGASGAATTATRRIWRNNSENQSVYGLDWDLLFPRTVPDLHSQFLTLGADEPVWQTEKATFKLGFSRDYTLRKSTQDSYFYDFPNTAQPFFNPDPALAAIQQEDLAKRSPDVSNPAKLWTDFFSDPDNLGTGQTQNSMRWFITPAPGDVDYDGRQELLGGYWRLEMPLTAQLSLMLGARLENTRISVDPRSDNDTFSVVEEKVKLGADGNPESSSFSLAPRTKEDAQVDIAEAHWLRAAALVYKVTPTMNARLNYGQTIARPTFLELVPILTEDFIDGNNTSGNNDLLISTIDNLDFRWEWFPKPGDVIALSWFYKDITNPIEKTLVTINSLEVFYPENFEEGRVRGFEAEYRKKLDFFELTRDVTLGLNTTLIEAEVKVPELRKLPLVPQNLDEDWRVMEGQPEFLFNANLVYDNELTGTNAGVFLNITGDVLKAGAAKSASGDGSGVFPNLFEEQNVTLDLSFSQTFGEEGDWKITLRAQNVLDPIFRELYITPDGDKTVRRAYQKGVSYSLSISKKW